MKVPIEDRLKEHVSKLGRCIFPNYYKMFAQDYPFEVVLDMTIRPTTHKVSVDKLFTPFEDGKGVWSFRSEKDRNYFNEQINKMSPDRVVRIKD